MDTMHEGYSGRWSSPAERELTDAKAGLEGYAVHGIVIDDPPPDPDRVSQLMTDLETSIQAARAKRAERTA